ncbi:ABC transporter ATP-binding protein [Ornithinibacillus halotolerans]|uniref:ABC transporter ATP-binding protein YfiB n=1 Tax=Ornithinibacillus halotolerans TaxID=1274357 RepID=A0A916W757_9BACI|nr:ABC transporter ATP-binding protein [Ornithinibacillus halotolerans]GGA74241.1 putative ABC transporter ATP-binding protein YfiB [Ornithinibacillus halotolerans]
MRSVFSFLKPYKLTAVIAFLLMLVELAVDLLLPFFLGKMIDYGIQNGDLNNIVMWGSIMIAMALFSFITGITNSFFASHVSWGFAYDIRERLFRKIQEFSFANLNRFATSHLMTLFTNDVRQIQNTIFMALRIMAKAPLLALGGVIMAFIVNPRLAIIFLISVPVLIGFLLWVLKKASKLFSRVQEKIDNVNQVMQENLAGMRLIKAFFRRNHEQDRFEEANTDLRDTTRFTFRFIEASMPILLFVMNLSIIAIIWFGNTQSIAGTADVGDVVAIVNYAMRVAMAISMFSFIIMALSRTKASAERIGELLDEEVDLLDKEDADDKQKVIDGKVEFKHVSFKYPTSDDYVLRDISFTVKPGEKLAIIGATGSGKSSLFQLIPRLYDTTYGELYIDDKPISSYKLDNLRKSIGYVPQSPLLFSGPIIDNIAWGKDNATHDEVLKAASDAQIHQTIMDLPNQYQTQIGQKGVNLSGGQKQRISIARALIRKPRILMLDDSTSALDLATEARLLEAIQDDLNTLFIITQKISTAMKADRILLLDEGKMLSIGTHEELLKESELYQRIVESQFGKEYPDVR